MNWPTRCAAVIPCRDEAETIGDVVAAVRRRVPTVLVVDDGSRDDTARVAAEAGATVLRHRKNFGKGAALRTGWAAARERGFGWAICLDGDGQHCAEEINAFFACAERTGARLVAGNRLYGAAAEMPWLRRVVNRWMSRRISRRAGCSLPDSQCGFRLLDLEAWARLPVHSNHYEIESELLLAFIRAGLGVEFVPIRVIYGGEHSKINPLTDTVRWLHWYGRARMPEDRAGCPASSGRAAPAGW